VTFGGPAATPPPTPASADPAALDSLSLDIPATADWSPIPAPDDADAPAAAPFSDSESSFAGMWDTTAPEISVGAPSISVPPPATHGVPAASPEIQTLLEEGDRLSEKGDHQGAIEVWSRIFLSDLSNPEAATRTRTPAPAWRRRTGAFRKP
jgi:hypothetical protein